jgi:acyl carrier protein
MTRDEMIAKLRDCLEDASPMVEMDGLGPDGSLEDAGLDSLDVVNFLLGIEETFGVKISDEDAEKLTTLNAYADHIAAAKS